jgi:hypothetical protein
MEEWFKTKKYPHIGLPITMKDYNWVKDYANNPDKIKVHSFLPLLQKTVVKRKYRAVNNAHTRNPSGKRIREKGKPKTREIFYSSHLDSLILSRYNEILARKYESFLEGKVEERSIVAYRKIPITKGSSHHKCNIDFAKDCFKFLMDNEDSQLSIIIADVTSFFDSLNHRILKKNWSTVLGEKTLPPDHYNIFKSLTNIRYVQGEQLFDFYKKQMIVQRGIPNSSKLLEYKTKSVKKLSYSREKSVVAFCTKQQFLKENLNLIISKKNTKGIPQGSAISATLANVYMIEFDKIVYDFVTKYNGFYQRYSDDIVVVCDQKYEDDHIQFLRNQIKDLVDLDIEPKKTKVFRYEKYQGKSKCFQIDEKTKKALHNYSLEYLGFSFDGQKVRIKSAGLAKYYRSMKRSFRKSTSLALYSKNPDKRIFKSRLYKRFTYKGANRKLIYRPSKENPKVYLKSKEFYWGNYLSYVYKSNETMRELNHDNSIKNQVRKAWTKFHSLLRTHEERVNERFKNHPRQKE